MLQELAEHEELKRQEEEYRLQQEQLELQRLEQERIAQEEEEMRKVCWASSVCCVTESGQVNTVSSVLGKPV